MKKNIFMLFFLNFFLAPNPVWALTQTEVSQLYVSILGRASEGTGNTYWQTDPSSTSMTVTANVMLNTEAAVVYFGPTLDDNQSFIEHIYINTLGKTYAEDPEGVNYWVNELNSGKSKGEVVAAIIVAAQDPVNAGAAQDRFNNRVEASNYCADMIAAYTDLDTFIGFINGVTDDDVTLTEAMELIDLEPPVTTFAVSFDEAMRERVHFVGETTDGGFFIGGYLAYSDWSYDIDAYLLKTDSRGNKIWINSFNSFRGQHEAFASSAQQTSDGGYIIAGQAARVSYLVKTDDNGNEIWFKTFTNSNSSRNHSMAHSVRQTSDDGYIIAGEINYMIAGETDYKTSRVAYLTKTDDSGNEIWSKTFGDTAGNTAGKSVLQTIDGGYIIAGDLNYNTESFLIKTDTNGNEIWSRTYETGFNCVQPTIDGGYIIAGDKLIKTDNSGNEEWSIVFDNSDYNERYYIYSVDQSMDGGYIFAGIIARPMGTISATDIYLLKTDNMGNKVWASFLGNDTDNEYAFAVKQTMDGGYIIAGNIAHYMPPNQEDALLIKTDSNGKVNE